VVAGKVRFHHGNLIGGNVFGAVLAILPSLKIAARSAGGFADDGQGAALHLFKGGQFLKNRFCSIHRKTIYVRISFDHKKRETNQTRQIFVLHPEETGYIRDQNVFRDGIDIEDSMSVLIKYRTGEMASYSLNTYCPCEGFRAAISGDRGRIEYVEKHDSHIIGEDGKAKIALGGPSMHLKVQKHFSEPYDVEISKVEGGHGGGDTLIREQIFSTSPPVDALGRSAGHEQGAASLLIGAAANISISNGQPVNIDDLVRLKPEASRLHELC